MSRGALAMLPFNLHVKWELRIVVAYLTCSWRSRNQSLFSANPTARGWREKRREQEGRV